MRKNKKILFAILILSLLLIAKSANAVCQLKEEAPPDCPINACEGATTPEACSALAHCCEWVGTGEGGERSTTCNICPHCVTIFSICFIQCIITYIILFPIRLVIVLIALIGLAVALAVSFIGLHVLPGIINTVIDFSLGNSYLTAPGLENTYNVVKDFALSLIVLFLLIIGIATIFKIAEYEARKALVSLLIGALLIHFSLPISKAIIGLGNYTTDLIRRRLIGESGDFLNSSQIFGGLNTALTTEAPGMLMDMLCLDGRWEVFFTNTLAQSGNRTVQGPVIIIIFLYALFFWAIASIAIFILTSYISFGVMFLMRTVFFVGLTIVSPIAFLTAAFRTKEMKKIFPGFLNWDDWWMTFLEWAFVGVSLIIWLAIAGMIANLRFPNSPDAIHAPDVLVSGNVQSVAQEAIVKLILYLLPILGAGTAVFFASMSAPKLGQQFAGAAFGFLNKVGSALITGGVVALSAFAGGALGAAVSGAKAIREAKGGWGKGKAFLKTAFNVPARGFGALAKEGIRGGVKAALTPIPAEMRKEAVEAWTRRVSAERAAKHIEDVEKKKGPKGVQGVVESRLTSDLEKKEGIKKALEGGYYKKDWLEDEGIKRLTLEAYEDAMKKGDKKTMEMMERRLALSLGGDLFKRKIERGEYTEKDIDEDVRRGIFTSEQGDLMRGLMEKVKRKEKLSEEEEKALKDLNTTKVIAGVKTADDIKQLEKGVIHEEAAMAAMQKFWTGTQWGAAAREFGRELINALEPIIEEIRNLKNLSPEELEAKYGTRDVGEAYKKIVWSMPGLARFSQTTTAQEVGIPSIWELAPDEIKYQMEERHVSEAGRARTVRVPVGRRYENLNQVLAERPLEKREAPI